MRRVAIQVLACLLCAGLAAPAAQAHRPAARDRSTAGPYWLPHPQFSDAEVRLVVNWFEDARQAGKCHFQAVPAAVAREIRVSAKLTANAVQSLVPPPAELLAKLPPLPRGYERLLAGSVLVIFKRDEGLIVDALPVRSR